MHIGGGSMSEVFIPYRIFNWYDEHGYVKVPKYYDRKYGNKCRICGWENTNTVAGYCSGECRDKYETDVRDKVFPMGFDHMSYADWIVFHAIEHQMDHGEEPYATPEEYADEIKTVRPKYYEKENEQRTSTEHRNSALYQHK